MHLFIETQTDNLSAFMRFINPNISTKKTNWYLAHSPKVSFVFGVMCVYYVIICMVAIPEMGKAHQKNTDEID